MIEYFPIYMKKSHLTVLLLFASFGIFWNFSTAFGDDVNAPTLSQIHQTLLQAAGYQSDTPPTIDQQTDLLNRALKMIDQVPHVYRGQLKAASRCINAALSELGNGDPAHKAKGDIYDADGSD